MIEEPVRLDVASTEGVALASYRWEPAGHPRGIVQIAHGVGEHARRYAPLARALTEQGFVVYSHDHRGHGATAASPSDFGKLGVSGWSALVDDLGRVGAFARHEHPTLPLVLIAHSLGSFAAQQYLLDHSVEVDVVVLSGTAAIDLLEPAMNLDEPMDLSTFNAAFQSPRTDFDWLTRDEDQVDQYIADPLCGFGLDIDGAKSMFQGARQIADPQRVASMRSELPVYIVVGEMDPVNGQLALVHALVERYRQAGLTDVTLRTYSGARHEVFTETNREEVVSEMIAWLNQVLHTAE